MPEKDHPKFSTSEREGLWWRANISKDDIRWVRQNLGHSLDGIARFEVVPASVCIPDGPIAHDWDERVEFVERETAPRVHLPLGASYNYRQEYRKARQAGDPYLSPHGLFRRLETGYHAHALEFMQLFGPLTWESSLHRGEEWVRLSDFWDKHARFVGVSMLWEARFDDQSLKAAWQWIYERRDQISRVGPAPFGSVPLWKVDHYTPLPEGLPWESEQGFAAEVDDLVDFGTIRKFSLEVVQNELNMHTADCRQLWLLKSIEGAGKAFTFEPTRGFESLWGAIWDLFGQDASALTHSWRLCLECGRLFYPKDRRSVCCTTEHQALWSKRKWAREHRGTGLLSKAPRSRGPKQGAHR